MIMDLEQGLCVLNIFFILSEQGKGWGLHKSCNWIFFLLDNPVSSPIIYFCGKTVQLKAFPILGYCVFKVSCWNSWSKVLCMMYVSDNCLKLCPHLDALEKIKFVMMVFLCVASVFNIPCKFPGLIYCFFLACKPVRMGVCNRKRKERDIWFIQTTPVVELNFPSETQHEVK